MKIKYNFLILFVFLFCAYSNVYATSNKAYYIGDHVYFNPIENKTCNYKNYWTPFNDTSNCYRFLVIADSASSDSNVKLLLNHDVARDTFANYSSVISKTKSEWSRYSGTMDILSESEFYSLSKLDKKPAIGESIHRTDSASLLPLRENTVYYIAGKKNNDAGFWTKTSHESDSTYAYTMTEGGNNKPVLKTEKRGIRPVITVDKSLVTDDKSVVNLDVTLSYGYNHLADTFDGVVYKQMQGFTMAGDKLFFYSSNNSNPSKGILFGFGGSGYNSRLGYIYGTMAHGNDMTYNSKLNTVYVAGADDGDNIWEFNADSFTNNSKPSKKITIKNNVGSGAGAIAYDKFDNQYFVKAYGAAISIDPNFTVYKDSFSIVHTETGQGFDWHNGYLYVSSFEIGANATCPSPYQLYCYGSEYTGTIYVYNAKYNSDGTPSPNFGKLVARYRFPTGYGELETVSFKGNKIILGVAAKHYDSTKTYKMFSTSVDVTQKPFYSIKYSDGNAIISSVEDLKSVSGWTLSSDKKSLTKKITSSDTSVNVCDRYGNCNEQALKALDTITFSDNTSTYTGSSITVDNATAKSGSDITYTYYSDTSCTTKITSAIDAGVYSVKATSAGNDSYGSNSKCAKLTVNKGNPIITASDKESTYTGSAITPNAPSAKVPNNTTSVNLTYSYNYYSDNECKTSISNAPINVGTYYYKATSSATSNLNSVSSSCSKIKITKANPSFNIKSSISMAVSKSVSVNYTTNSSGNVTCSSSNEDVATCSVSGNKLIIASKSLGMANISLSQAEDLNFNAKTGMSVSVTVNDISTDTVSPIVSFNPNGDDNYTKIKTIKVKLSDNETYIKGNQVVYYAFSKSNVNEPNYTKTITLSNIDEDEKVITIPNEEFGNLTGSYYLWIKEGILDANNNSTQKLVSNVFNFNNTIPTVIGRVVKSKKGIKGTISIDSLSSISSCEYSTDGTTYKSFSNNIFKDSYNPSIEKYYVKVTDNLNQSNIIELEVEDELKTLMELYVVDANNNNFTNNIIRLSDKELYYHLMFLTPSIDYLFEKYNKFSITNKIDNNVKFNIDDVKIYNKSNEDVTNNFDLEYKNRILSINSKNVSNDNFYNELYDVQYKVLLPENGLQTLNSNKIINNASLYINDEEEVVQSTESNLSFEVYEDIPNTFLNSNLFIYIFGFIIFVLGTYIITSIVINNEIINK